MRVTLAIYLFASALVLACARPAAADPFTGYGIRPNDFGDNALYSFTLDPTAGTMQSTQIGPTGFGIGALRALAAAPNGTLYGISALSGVGDGSALYTISRTTGAASLVGALTGLDPPGIGGIPTFAGADFSPDGGLIGVSREYTSPIFYNIPLAPGGDGLVHATIAVQETFPVPSPIDYGQLAYTVAVDGGGRLFYLKNPYGYGNRRILSVLDMDDMTTDTNGVPRDEATVLGPILFEGNMLEFVNGMDFGPDGNLYFLHEGSDAAYRIDYANGPFTITKVASSLGTPSVSPWDALAFTPAAAIPEPETYAMLLAGLGLLGLAARRSKQKKTA